MTNPSRFEGDGRPTADGDTRVRCWFCAFYTHDKVVAIWKRSSTGKMITVKSDCRTCRKGLGHDAFVLRRCDTFKPLPAAQRKILPDEAFQRGWRIDYGTDEYVIGEKNQVRPADEST